MPWHSNSRSNNRRTRGRIFSAYMRYAAQVTMHAHRLDDASNFRVVRAYQRAAAALLLQVHGQRVACITADQIFPRGALLL